ncbi:hypothetical protein CEB3_c13290 [Peptococcaceae bacterium CEB3]|nr:hypothetical protein CEB3_c13290 [Peptococcaceae bacterium CEB3]
MPKRSLAVHLEYECKTCRKIVSRQVHRYEPVETFEELDLQLGHTNFPITPFACPQCGAEHMPETMAVYDITNGKMARCFAQPLGSPELTVVASGDSPYGVVMSPEEQAEYERGLAKAKECFQEHEEAFWAEYFAFAQPKWRELLKEFSQKEYVEAYKALGVPVLSFSASIAAWRKDAEKRFTTDAEKTAFWRAANRYLVDEEFVWVPVDTWPMDRWVQTYGRERVTYLTLHLPLPEELEKYRTEKLSRVIRKKSGEAGVLFERIGQLGRELEKQKKRSFKFSQELMDLRQETGKLREELAQAKRQLEAEPTVIDRQADDARKIREFKGLINELRTEIERLSALIPNEEEPEDEGRANEEVLVPTVPEEVDLSGLAGKTILIVGLPNEEINDGYRVIWHDGDKVDVKLQTFAREADIFVFLTRFGAHAVMWWLKEEAIEQGKPVYFVRERNLERILEGVLRG